MKEKTLGFCDEYGDYYYHKCFFIKDKSDLGKFISDIKPCINLNKIPIGKWFMYTIDDSGDHRHDDFVLLEEYLNSNINYILKLANKIDKIKKIINQ